MNWVSIPLNDLFIFFMTLIKWIGIASVTYDSEF